MEAFLQVLAVIIGWLLAYGGMGAVFSWFVDTAAGQKFVDLVARFLAWYKPGEGEVKRHAIMAISFVLAFILYAASCIPELGLNTWPATFPEWMTALQAIVAGWGVTFGAGQIRHARTDPALRARF